MTKKIGLPWAHSSMLKWHYRLQYKSFYDMEIAIVHQVGERSFRFTVYYTDSITYSGYRAGLEIAKKEADACLVHNGWKLIGHDKLAILL